MKHSSMMSLFTNSILVTFLIAIMIGCGGGGDSGSGGGNGGTAVAAPTFSPTPGPYATAQDVEISTTTSGASIRYTTDGSTPSETVGTVYSSKISVTTTTTIKAVAYKTGLTTSSVSTGAYTISPSGAVAAPTFSPTPGPYSTTQDVTISTTTPGATIRYTTDGTTPSETVGTVYSSKISVTTTTTIKAVAYKTGLTTLAATTATYTIAGTCSANVVTVNADITTPTTWTENNIYVIDRNIYITSTLTIGPGVIIKFRPGNFLRAQSGAAINANGTAAKRIVFTSIKDDARGCDTNGDGGASLPARGDWISVQLEGNGSSFKNCDFYYSGNSGAGDPALDLYTVANTTVDNCVFAHNDGGDLTYPTGALNASGASTGTVITNNTFFDNRVPMTISGAFNVDDTNTFHDPGNPSVRNTYNGIVFDGVTGTVSTPRTWSETEVPLVINRSTYVPGGTLTIGPGVTIKFQPGSFLRAQSGAAINANGTAAKRIVFTSIKDDARGGDTNGDGGASLPARGDWISVQLEGNGSSFKNCDFYYSGNSGAGDPALDLYTVANTTVDNCVFAHNDGGDLTYPTGALNAGGASTGTAITNNTFYDNRVPMTISSNFNVDDTNTFHDPGNPSVKNTYNGIAFNDVYANVSTPKSWTETEVPFVIPRDMYITSTLTFGANVVLKCQAGVFLQISIGGSMGVPSSVAFTSIKDDTRLGDTNGDGTASSPATNDWLGIYVESSSSYLNGPQTHWDQFGP